MIRADALATLYFFHPLRKVFRPRPGSVPILMYHSISDRSKPNVHPYFQTVTSPRVFRDHMQFLYDNGFETVGIPEALSYMKSPSQRARKPVVVTFDDGFLDFYTEAAPILGKFGFVATMYLPTSFIGASPKDFKGVPCMTWDQVRELDRGGMTFGSHTVTHPQLASVSLGQVKSEVCESKAEIEQELGHRIDSFAYPYAFPQANQAFTSRLFRFLEQAGYSSGVTTAIGMAHSGQPRHGLSRLPVNSWDRKDLLAAKVDGGYDWLHPAQSAVKRFKGLGRS